MLVVLQVRVSLYCSKNGVWSFNVKKGQMFFSENAMYFIYFLNLIDHELLN
jgi:hypothetical protein